ncbi:hypothetical protein AAVH_42203 [Aphelenchoides avenae]|nr:hypothetical protein AAVH_42203 [Aphelenchus avenae]
MIREPLGAYKSDRQAGTAASSQLLSYFSTPHCNTMKFVLALGLTVCAAYAQPPNGPIGGPVPPRRPPPPAPQQQCRRPGEVFVPCSYPDGTCSQPVPLYCPLSCGRPACRCRPGWVRNAQNTCVPVARCPQVGGLSTSSTGATSTASTSTTSSTSSTSTTSTTTHSTSTTPTTATTTTVSGLPTLPTGVPTLSTPSTGAATITLQTVSTPSTSTATSTLPTVTIPGVIPTTSVPGTNSSGISSCAQGELFTLCSTTEATCANLIPAWPRQQPRYGPPKCQCLPGYVRQNGTCVPLANCFAGVTGPTTPSTPTTSANITLPTPPIPVPGSVGK